MASSMKNVDQLQAEYEGLERQLDKIDDRDQALEIAIEAAQICMKALKIATDSRQKSNLRSKANSFLNKAESIKSGKTWSSPSSQPASKSSQSNLGHDPPTSSTTPSLSSTAFPIAKTLREPVNSRVLPVREQNLLLRASMLGGFKFPPWEKTPQPDIFARGIYIEEKYLQLSEQQMMAFSSWKRPTEALPPPGLSRADTNPASLTMVSSRPVDLVQDAASDCSVVASLCAITAREERGFPTILRNTFFPFDDEANAPQLSINGLYILRLNFNGTWRIVTIDDRLPTCKGDRMLHTVDLNCPGLLWPALLEKAYLKVRGGYDFPGSNSCTDLWVLTGWIPEQVFLQDEETDPYAVWRRMQTGFQYGDVLISLGTGKMSRQAEKALGLAAEHNYAVLDLKEEGEHRMVLLKNPWREGRLPSAESAVEVSEDEQSLINAEEWERTKKRKTRARNAEVSISGTSWMELRDVLQNFESIYLNWNPGLFNHRADIHFRWKFQETRGMRTNFVDNPQFSITSKETVDVWLLLCRHFSDTTSASGSLAPATAEYSTVTNDESIPSERSGYLSLYAFDRNGNRVRSHDNPLKRSQYVDSAQVLLQLELPAKRSYTIVPSEQSMPAGTHSFTLIAFTSKPIELSEAANRYPSSVQISSSWNISNAGGHGNSVTFAINPQFKLTVTKTTRVAVILDNTKAELNVNVKLLYGGGKRASKVTRQDVILDSGDYRAGMASAEIEELEAGVYTVICSTFEAGQEGRFTLRVDSLARCHLEALPNEAAGRFRVDDIHPAIFKQGTSILAAPLMINRMVKMTAIARAHVPRGTDNTVTRLRSRSPVRLYFGLGSNVNNCRVLAANSSGDFDGSEAGVRTEDVDLWPGMRTLGSDIWLVLERLSPPGLGDAGSGAEVEGEGFRVELLVDGIRRTDWEIGPWRVWEP